MSAESQGREGLCILDQRRCCTFRAEVGGAYVEIMYRNRCLPPGAGYSRPKGKSTYLVRYVINKQRLAYRRLPVSQEPLKAIALPALFKASVSLNRVLLYAPSRGICVEHKTKRCR